MQPGELCSTLGQRILEEIEPLFEAAGSGGRVEDEEFHFIPEVVLVLATDNADGALELLAINPQFAIERHRRQSFNEPRRGVIEISLTRKKSFPVP